MVLGDITGLVSGTVHSEVFGRMKRGFDVGSVLVLRDLWGIVYLEREESAPRLSGVPCVHLSVQLSNIVEVFQPSCPTPARAVTPSSVDGWIQELRTAYTKEALAVSSNVPFKMVSDRAIKLARRRPSVTPRRFPRVFPPSAPRKLKSSIGSSTSTVQEPSKPYIISYHPAPGPYVNNNFP